MLLRLCFIISVLVSAAYATEQHPNPTSLSINRFVLATGIENREPVNPKENFSTSDEKVVAFADFSSHADETVTFVWTHNDKVHTQWSTHVTVSPRFRTYAIIQARPGKWSVKVQDSKGTVLKEQSFEVNQNSDHGGSTTGSSLAATEKLAKKIKNERPKGMKEALSSLEPDNKKSYDSASQPIAETAPKSEK